MQATKLKKCIDEREYNFIVSNIILSQKGCFTYNDIMKNLYDFFSEITDEILCALNDCLIRLREDGFLNVLGSKYCVVDLEI